MVHKFVVHKFVNRSFLSDFVSGIISHANHLLSKNHVFVYLYKAIDAY